MTDWVDFTGFAMEYTDKAIEQGIFEHVSCVNGHGGDILTDYGRFLFTLMLEMGAQATALWPQGMTIICPDCQDVIKT